MDDERIERLLANLSKDQLPIAARLAFRQFSAADRHLVPRLKEILADSDPDRSHCVASVLAVIGGAEALDTLLARIDYSGALGVSALRHFVPDDDRQTAAILAALDRVIESESNAPFLRRCAIDVSCGFRNDVSPVLLHAASSQDSWVSGSAKAALVQVEVPIGGRRGGRPGPCRVRRQPYVPRGSDDPRLRPHTPGDGRPRGRGGRARPDRLPAVVGSATRINILKLLARIGRDDPLAKGAIADAIDQSNAVVRLAAIQIVAEFGLAIAAEAVPALTRARSAKNLHVRQAAEQALRAVRPSAGEQ